MNFHTHQLQGRRMMLGSYKHYNFTTGRKEWKLHSTFCRRGLSLCLQVEKNSLLLFKVAPSGLNMMLNFSLKHRLQRLVEGLKLCALVIIFHVIVCGVLEFFSFHTWLLRLVLSFS